jgi:hypothetical protein
MKTLEERLERIEQILRDNKQHELLCPAHVTASDMANPLGGMFMSHRESQCNCWISEANPSTDPTKGFGIYENDTKTLRQYIFPSRYVAVEHICWSDNLSRDPKAENYYGNHYLITEVTAQPRQEDTP